MTFTVGAPAAPTLVGPSGGAVAGRPAYGWNAVTGAVDYYLWVNGPAGTAVVQQWFTAAAACTGAACTATPAVDLSAGTHQFWVQARNAIGAGPWSAAMSFTVGSGAGTPTPTPAAPPGVASLTGPSGTVAATTPTYSWTAVTGAADYYLWVNGPSGGPVVQTWLAGSAVCSGSACAVTPATRLANGTHTFWIQARNAAGNGPWSSAMTFTVSVAAPAPPPAPILQGPTGSVTTPTPAYRWNPSAGATGYYLWVNNGAGAVALQMRYGSAICATTCSVTPAAPLASGAYTFWVQASNDVGNGPWSAAMSFTVP